MNLKQAATKLNISEQVLNELMSDCQLNPDADGTDEQFQMLVEGLFTMIGRQSLARNEVGSWNEEKLVTVEKLMMLYLLHNEKERLTTLLSLCDLLVLSRKTTSHKDLTGLLSIARNCIAGNAVKNLGFSKNNLENMMFSQLYCLALIQNVTFVEQPQDGPALLYEGKGMVTMEQGNIVFSPVNYKKSRKLETAFTLLDFIQVKYANSDRPDGTKFESIEEFLKNTRQLQRSMTQSYHFGALKKTYNEGDWLCVKVIQAGLRGITAVSVDTAYEQISGTVDTNSLNFYYRENIRMAIIGAYKRGKTVYLRVKKAGTGFSLQKTLEEFISERVESLWGAQHALCINKFKNGKGLRWLTSGGLIVNVLDDKCSEEDIGQYDAIEDIATSSDNNGNLCLNGSYSVDDYEDGPDWFYFEPWKEAMDRTLGKFAADFVDSMEVPEQKTAFVPLRPEYVKAFAHLLFSYSQTISNSCERLKTLGTARLLSIAVSSNEDIEYLKFEQNYLSKLVAFARGESDKRKLKLELTDELKEVTELREKADVCEQLSRYDIFDPLRKQGQMPSLQSLINASNTLQGVLGLPQLDSIKRKIAESLHVEDEYCSIIPKTDKEEGKDIEYKTSIIYSPMNMKTPEYDKQMGRILKTICAFLNSENGGTLVIGETDDHGVNGFMEDIRKLKADRRIKSLNKDDYWLYLKYYIDSAFKEESSFASGKEITASRIEKNYVVKDGKEVLNISVQPYIYDIVEFALDLDGLKGTAWYRSDANTLEMTLEMRHQILRKKKLKWDNTTEKIRQILDAKKKMMAITFKDYPSKSRTKDRHVEAYYVFQDIDAVICYDLDDKKNKEYKISRIGKVEVIDQPWKYQQKHRSEPKVDIFKFLEQEKSVPYHIVLRLSPYAKMLLVEEFPRSRSLLDPSRRGTKNRLTESEDKQYWTLETDVYRLESVGRFCLGLMNQIRVEECDALKEYIKGEIEKFGG